ncbi:MAG TPA: tetratricopeptide repeat protein [Allosphingosinicella sp.]|nr:tetratricopeptide repeat protein [Allosphingosinicella sp.]
MNRTVFKIAASTVIIAMTMVACTAQSDAMRRIGSVSRADSRSDRQAADLHALATAALQQGQLSRATDLIEQAVALSPRDVGYRLLLADAYLKNGRFDSARATYADVVALDPANVRAGLSIALIQIAQGRPQSAATRLNDLEGRAPAADVGLAYALAGRTDRAIALLESAARSPSATPRTRQNLALAYAMAGDWRRARAIAAQDVSPADLDARMQQWAAFARPDTGDVQVATLLGVTPGQDPGQPTRLALAPAADAPLQAFAEAAPIEAPIQSNAEFAAASAPAAPEAPVEIAAAEAVPAEAPAFWVPTAQSYQPAPEAAVPAAVAEEDGPAPEAPAVPRETQVRYAAAARTLVQPRPDAIRAAAPAALPVPLFQRARPVVRSGNAPVVVQLGAFISEANAERAWVQHARRYNLQDRRPLTTTININGRNMHRVSVSGFASAVDAQRLCGSIKSQGGVCFVRAQAGDASIRWAARYAPSRRRAV